MRHLKLVRGVRGALLAYVVWCHVKEALMLSRYGASLNLDKEVITRAPIINGKSNFMINQNSLHIVYLDQCIFFQDWQCLGVSNVLTCIHQHGHICLSKAEEEYTKQSSCDLWQPPVFSLPWSCGLAGCKYRKKASNLSWWLWENRVVLGQVCHTPQRTACHHKEPYRLQLQWSEQRLPSL